MGRDTFAFPLVSVGSVLISSLNSLASVLVPLAESSGLPPYRTTSSPKGENFTSSIQIGIISIHFFLSFFYSQKMMFLPVGLCLVEMARQTPLSIVEFRGNTVFPPTEYVNCGFPTDAITKLWRVFIIKNAVEFYGILLII